MSRSKNNRPRCFKSTKTKEQILLDKRLEDINSQLLDVARRGHKAISAQDKESWNQSFETISEEISNIKKWFL